MASKKAFITGGTGFVGINLLHKLVEDGWHCTVLHRKSSDLSCLKAMPIDFVEGSVEDRDSLIQAVPNNVDALFHVAAMVSFWSPRNHRQTLINVTGTANVADVALAKKVKRFIHTSSVAAYGFHSKAIDETSEKRGIQSGINYFRTKHLAELEVMNRVKAGLDAVILNPANIIGPYDFSNWSRMYKMVRDKKIPGSPKGLSSFAHVDEVARAHLSAYEKGRTGENYLLGGCDRSYAQVTTIMSKLLGLKSSPHALPSVVIRASAQLETAISMVTKRHPTITPEMARVVTHDLLCVSTKAINELNYKERSLESMLTDCHNWMVAEKML